MTFSAFHLSIISSFEVLSIFSIIIQYVFAFIKSPQFGPLLYEWNVIEQEFPELWTPSPSLKGPDAIKKFQFNFATFYLILPTFIFGSLIAYWLFDLEYPIHCFIILIYAYFSLLCYLAEDAKAILLFKCLEVGFGKVNFVKNSQKSWKKWINFVNIHLGRSISWIYTLQSTPS